MFPGVVVSVPAVTGRFEASTKDRYVLRRVDVEIIRRLLKRTPISPVTPDRAGTPYRTAAANTASRRCVVHAANLPRWTRWIGADDSAIYFTGDLSIYSLPHGATVPTRLTDPRVHVANAALGESLLVWNTREGGPEPVTALWSMPVSGGTPRKIATASGATSDVVVHAGRVFWITTRHESDPSNDKFIRHWWETIHVHDLATGEEVAPAIEREASFRGFTAADDGVCWIETPTRGPMLRCSRTANGELRVVPLGKLPASLHHGSAAIADGAAYLAAFDGTAIEAVDLADGSTTTFATLSAPIVTLRSGASNLYAITGRHSRPAREVWSIDRTSRVAERIAEYKTDKLTSGVYTRGDIGLVGHDVFVCGDSRILRITM